MRAILIATLAAGLAGPALAQSAGSYGMTGVSTIGEAYQGSAVLVQTGRETWQVTWRGADGEPLVGIGIAANGVLSVGFVLSGAQGVAWYRIMPDGTLEGRWAAGTDGRVGTERLVPK